MGYRVYAAGDCVETYHRLLGRSDYLPLGTIAHKQGRVAGENAARTDEEPREFPGSLGTQVVKVFELVIARTGLLEEEARTAGFDPLTSETEAYDHKQYYPGARRLRLRVTADRVTGRLLGARIMGPWGAEIAKRADVFATALYHGMRVGDLNDLDLSYTPLVGAPWDVPYRPPPRIGREPSGNSLRREAFAMRRLAAEFLGTFLLVFAGTGAVVVNEVSGGGVGSLGIGLSFGLAVMAAIYAIGHISGAHINPAVTVAFALSQHFPWRLVPSYIGAQLLGASAASATHLTLFGNVADLGATTPSGSSWQALGLEIALTLFLMFVIAAVATDVRAVGQAAAIAIGGYVALAATFAGPIAGASMNPARSLGPALLSGTWNGHWAYWVGPLLGAALGALLYRYVREANPPVPAEEKAATSR